MDKFLNRSAPQFRHALLDEVFHRLYIVVGHAFEGFDFLCICFGKRGVNRPEILQCLRFKRRQIQRGLTHQCDEVLHLHFDTVFHESPLREVGRQRSGSVSVTAVDGRKGCEFVQLHESGRL